MRIFKDKHGSEWKIEIDFGSHLDIKDKFGVNLLTLAENNFRGWKALRGDDTLTFRVIFFLIAEQAEAQGITKEKDFAKRLGGQSIQDAIDAFEEEILDFFHDRRVAEALRKMKRKVYAAGTEALAEVDQAIEAMTAESLGLIPKKKSGESPASSALTRDPSSSAT